MLKPGERVVAFMNEVFPAALATTRRDGSIQLNPLWFEYADDYFWLNGTTTRDWIGHMRRDPRVTLLLVDPANMFRWAQALGSVVTITEDLGQEHINRLAHRYTGRPFGGLQSGEQRLKVQIEPLRITGREGGKAWD